MLFGNLCKNNTFNDRNLLIVEGNYVPNQQQSSSKRHDNSAEHFYPEQPRSQPPKFPLNEDNTIIKGLKPPAPVSTALAGMLSPRDPNKHMSL